MSKYGCVSSVFNWGESAGEPLGTQTPVCHDFPSHMRMREGRQVGGQDNDLGHFCFPFGLSRANSLRVGRNCCMTGPVHYTQTQAPQDKHPVLLSALLTLECPQDHIRHLCPSALQGFYPTAGYQLHAGQPHPALREASTGAPGLADLAASFG